MSIKDILEKIKSFYALLLIVVIGTIFLALYYLFVLEKQNTPIKIEYSGDKETALALTAISSTSPVINNPSGEVIGVKTSKKYYFPWCGTLKRTKIENQIHFTSSDIAKKAGYIHGGGCKGLQ